MLQHNFGGYIGITPNNRNVSIPYILIEKTQGEYTYEKGNNF